jgi:RNA polymerase-binding transcription factor DksA
MDHERQVETMRNDAVRAALVAERDHLEETRDALLLHAGPDGGTQREDTGELSGMDEHIADVASDTFEREVDLGLLHAVQADLAAVDAALNRLATGTYGRCERCAVDIGHARLVARPAAALCLAHQHEAERADAMLRRSILHGGTDLEAAAHLDLLPVEDPAGTSYDDEAIDVSRT